MKMRINFFFGQTLLHASWKIIRGRNMANFGVEIVLGMPKHNEQTGRAEANFSWGGPSKYEK